MENLKPQNLVIEFKNEICSLMFLACLKKSESRKCLDLEGNKLLVPNTDLYKNLISQRKDTIISNN